MRGKVFEHIKEFNNIEECFQELKSDCDIQLLVLVDVTKGMSFIMPASVAL